MRPEAIRVGELAKRTGVSVRTLHYYEEIGLLAPSRRSEAGYRLYGDADVVRLQQIMSLRQLGFSLEQIRDCLHRDDVPLLARDRDASRAGCGSRSRCKANCATVWKRSHAD